MNQLAKLFFLKICIRGRLLPDPNLNVLLLDVVNFRKFGLGV